MSMHMRALRSKRPFWFAGASLLAVFCLTGPFAKADDAARRTYAIAPQPVSAALKQFAAQSHMQLIFSESDLGDARTAGVKGTLSPRDALATILRGTGLQFELTPNDVIVVRRAGVTRTGASPPQSSGGALSPNGKSDKGKRNGSRGGRTDGGHGSGTSADAVEPATTAEVVLQEVVVTAQKRRERLIDTPQSVTVLPADELARRGATQLRDLVDSVPGMSLATAGTGYTQITLRGVTTGFDLGSTVGIYVDDVPYGSSSPFADGPRATLDTGLFDLDHIEVLKGPQGTLYGASTMGGLIKYVTRRPDAQGVDGDVRAGVSDTGDGGGVNFLTAASVNLPIIPGASGLRASAFESHDGGYIDNAALKQRDVNRSDVYGGRLDFLVTPNDALSIRLTGFLQNTTRDGEGTADYTYTGGAPYGALGQYRAIKEPFDQHFRLISGTVDYDMPWASFTSISSYQTMSSVFDGDLTAGYAPYCQYAGYTCSALGYVQETSTNKFTQEVRLTSKNHRTIEWLVGAFYTHEASDLAQQYLPYVDGASAFNNLFTYDAPSKYQEYAGFGDLTWHITQDLDVTGGLRYAKSNQSKAQIGSGLFGLSHPEVSSTDHVLTYLGNVRYHFSDGKMGYLRYATGYRPGGPNLVTENPATGQLNGPATFAPDRLQSYEAGFKADSADRRLGVDMALYDIEWKNLQVTVTKGGFSTIENASGGARIRGAELALNALPIEGLRLSLAGAYQNAKLSQAQPDLGAYQGEALPNVPKYSGSLNADYGFAARAAGWRPSVGATVSYASGRNASFDADPGFPQYHMPGYAMVNLRSGIRRGGLNIELLINNLLDRRAQLSTYTWRGYPEVAIAQPRTVGIQLNAQF